jgi:ABC-type sugar transport system ATPase subunit
MSRRDRRTDPTQSTQPPDGSAAEETEGRPERGTEAARVEEVHKAFGAIRALRGVDLSLRPGEVHSLVGANGAGKSTLAKVLSGLLVPDRGRVLIGGRVPEHASLAGHASLGVGALYQEATIVPHLPASTNALLAKLRRRGPLVDRRRIRDEFLAHCRRLGISIDPDIPAGLLPAASQRMLEIIRALDSRHEVLLMDEPTGSLGPGERQHFYRVVRDLAATGVAVLYISHDLGEVLSLSDRISVMRDGRLVETRPARRWSKPQLVQAMLGREATGLRRPRRQPDEEPVLQVSGLSLPDRLRGISFHLRRGEILGIAGLVGSGRSELLRVLAGAEPAATGTLVVRGRRHPAPRSIREAMRLGIAMTPEDRRRDGIVPAMSAEMNIILSDLWRVSGAGVIDPRRRRLAAQRVARWIGLPEEMLGQAALELSGGSQQKLVVGRWLHRLPSVLLLDEPTVGIDVGAKRELLDFLRELASSEGVSIVMVSAEWEELIEVSDRIMVIAGGRMVGELAHDEARVDRILSMVFGVEGAA